MISQVKLKMLEQFRVAKKTLPTNGAKMAMVAVNGWCYGRDNRPDKGDYFKYCGQRFWEFISGESELYIEIIEPLGYEAKAKNDEFIRSYARMLNKFTMEFSGKFCRDDGEIDWENLVRFNSAP